MEKLLVLSDIHGNVRRAAAVVTAHTDCTACLFLGDGTRHIEYLRGLAPHMAFVAVRGNCDTFLDGDYPSETIFAVEGHAARRRAPCGRGHRALRAHASCA